MLHFSTQRFSYGELPQNTISKKCKITNTTLLFSYFAKAKPLVLNVSWDLQIRRRVGTGSKCSVLPWMSWCINGSVFHLHKCNEVLLGLRVWTDGFTGAPGSGKSLWCHYRTPIMFSFASVNCTSGRASLANPHRCSRGLCIHISRTVYSHYMRVIARPSQASNMAAHRQSPVVSEYGSNPGKMLRVHRGIWS